MPSIVNQMMLEEMLKSLENNPYAFISSFEGLPVSEISDLRRKLEKVAKRSILMKHTLANKAFERMELKGPESFLKGNVLVTMGDREPQLISKAIVEFSKANKKFVPRGVVFERKVYDESFVKTLADLPSRHELLTQVVVRAKSPITGFVMTLNQLLRGLAVAIGEIRKKKEATAVG